VFLQIHWHSPYDSVSPGLTNDITKKKKTDHSSFLSHVATNAFKKAGN
jgi:hypothetical protein